MRSYKKILLAASALILMSADTPVKNTYTLAKGYAVSIHGTSNLHDWDENVMTVSGESIVTWNSNTSFDLVGMNIKMAVRSIKSTEGSMMNNNTYKALKADDHPEIVFELAAQLPNIPVDTKGKVVEAKVNLFIAGVTKAIDMSVTVTAVAHGNISFEGSKTIKMTDYGVKPPVAMLGTMKTGDAITIHFKTVFAGK